MASARESGRLKDANQKRVLDEAARRRRMRKALEALEQDNFHDDPHADLGKFELDFETCFMCDKNISTFYESSHMVVSFLFKLQ